MLRNRFIYIVLVLYTLGMVLLYVEDVPIQVLAVEILLGIISGACLLYQKKKVTFSAEAVMDSIPEEGSRQRLCLTIRNDSVFPVFYMDVQITVTDMFGRVAEKKSVPVRIGIPAHESVRAQLAFEPKLCGRLVLTVRSCRIYDFLRIWRRRSKCDYTKEYYIQPQIHDMNVSVSMITRQMPVDSDVFDPDHPGDDTSEVYRIREYQPGDKMSAVHWKMTARSADEVMVKDFSLPIGSNVVVLVDLYTEERKAGSEASVLTGIMACCLSLSVALLGQECPHQLLWAGKNGSISRSLLNKEEDLPEAMARLMNVAGAEDRRQFERVVMSGYRQEYVSVVIITGRKRCGTGTEAHPVWDLERVMGNKVLLQVREGHADTVAGEGGQLFVIGTDNLAQCIEAISLEL